MTEHPVTEAFHMLAANCRELERTILLGWPHERYPTDEQALAIESTYHELCLAEPDLGDQRCWYLAGQIVARIERDRSSSGE